MNITYIDNVGSNKMNKVIAIIVSIGIIFYAGMKTQKFLMEDQCLDFGGNVNEGGICNVVGEN